MQDLGFLSFTLPEVAILMPTKKPRGGELSLEQERANQALMREGLVDRGETIVVMAGRIPEQPSLSSMMKLHRVGEIESVGG